MHRIPMKNSNRKLNAYTWTQHVENQKLKPKLITVI